MNPDSTPGTLPALFASQAQRSPDHPAVVRAGRGLTYAQLDAASDRVAAGVAGRGAGPGDIVGLCMHRSPAMLAAALGILKAGAAYLPIDPVFPAERLHFMTMDSGAALVLADEDLAERIPADVPVLTPLTMESGGQVRGPAPEDVAYVAYTSGSTGRPKGVAIEHRAVTALMKWAVSYFTRAELSRVLASTTLSFDVAVFELFAPLMAGGTVVLARDLLELPDLPEAGSLTLITTVPSVLEQLIAGHGIPMGVPAVGLVGEPVPRQLARRLYERFGVSRVVNLYGPTETTIYSTVYTVPPDEEGPVPIGWPLPGERMHVIEPGGPAGAEVQEGELCIAGIGLARGYLGRPALTAGKFVPEVAGEAGSRMYHTGDLVRRRPDGCLEILGRLDTQVKIRGFRVELGEIETVLGQFPGIAQLRAAVRDDPTGRKRLVVYACAEDSQPTVSLHELREYGARVLPDYMLPTDLVTLERMPLLPNGKIDRAALPALAADEPEQPAADADADADAYHAVISAWQSVLTREDIAPDDDFFDIGGDSLTSVRAIWQLRADLHADIPLTAIYESRTARRLSEWISEHARPSSAASGQVMTQSPASAGVAAHVPVTIGQEDYLRRADWQAEHGTPDRVLVAGAAFRLTGELDVARLRNALRALPARHEALRVRFARDGDRRALSVLAHSEPALSEVQPAATSGQGLLEWAQHEFSQPFDRYSGPPFRCTLARLGTGENLLILAIDHLVCDGWSFDMLLRDLSSIYNDSPASDREMREPGTVSYLDHVRREHEWLASERGKENLAYWETHLREMKPRPPTDFAFKPRGTRPPTLRAISVKAPLPDLAGAATAHAATELTVFAASVSLLLAACSGESTVGFVTPLSNRWTPENQLLFGWLSNVIPVRVDIGDGMTLSELIAHVGASLMNGIDHAQYPVHDLIRRMQPDLFGRIRNFATAYVDVPATGTDQTLSLAGIRTTEFPVAENYPIHGLRFALAPGSDDHGRSVVLVCEAGWLTRQDLTLLAADLAYVAQSLATDSARTVADVAGQLRCAAMRTGRQ